LITQPVAGGPVLWYVNPSARQWVCDPLPDDALAFHRQLPGYRPTPLTEVPGLAADLEVGRLFVKDESARFDLAAFKFLGTSWASFRKVSQLWGYRGGGSLSELRDWVVGRAPIILVTATDGNHGRAVARTARLLGGTARVYVPAAVPPVVVDRVAAEGVVVARVEGDYDAAVAAARADVAADPGAVLIQDTSWPGYSDVPGWIVEGYSTLLSEIDAQLAEHGIAQPGLVSVPVGVGSLAQAAVAHYRSQGAPASVLSVEPDTAACVAASLRNGRLQTVPTGLTIMNGLNCGTPSFLAWPYLQNGLDGALAVTDDSTRRAVADLAAAGIVSGPSGAASLAGARVALTGEGSPERRHQLRIDRHAVVVCISSEGFATAAAR
jgi:diaminopropionate ammonia-lyase